MSPEAELNADLDRALVAAVAYCASQIAQAIPQMQANEALAVVQSLVSAYASAHEPTNFHTTVLHEGKDQ